MADLTHERLYSTGTLIRKLREEKGISMSEFSRQNNVNKQTLYKYERDIIRNVPYNIIKIFADALNVNPAYLVGWSDVKERNPEMGLINDTSVDADDVIKQHINEVSESTIASEVAAESSFTTTNIGE